MIGISSSPGAVCLTWACAERVVLQRRRTCRTSETRPKGPGLDRGPRPSLVFSDV